LSTVYGPVPSWRFGRSLGIDVIAPPKKCTFNCIYCQLGRTKIHITGPEELDEPPIGVDRVLFDLEETMERINVDTVDIVTFSGTGEPTLNPELDKIAKEVKNRIKDVPLAILTNSSLLHRDNVRKNLSHFDLVVAKLDAGDDKTLQLINRPADGELDLETILSSIKRLKRGFEGDLALEVMLLSSEHGEVTNVEGKPLRRLLDAILDVKPNVVQLEIPYRPSSESFVKTPSRERINLISKGLAGALGEDKLWVYGLHDRRGKRVSWLTHKSLEREAINLLKRRPCRDADISASLGIGLAATRNLLKNLEEKNIIIAKISKDERYYSYR